MIDTSGANPKFEKWLGAQADAVKGLISTQWEALGKASDIAHQTPQGRHARLARLMSWCAANHGYDFT